MSCPYLQAILRAKASLGFEKVTANFIERIITT